MSDLRKAAQMALDAIDVYAPDYMHALPKKTYVKALRAALAQPEPFNPDWDRVKALEESLREHMAEIHRLKALAQPEQEPVAWMTPKQDLHLANEERFRHSTWTPLYTTPLQRKPLTDEEIERIANSVRVDSVYAKKSTWHVRLIRAIEKAHGIE